MSQYVSHILNKKSHPAIFEAHKPHLYATCTIYFENNTILLYKLQIMIKDSSLLEEAVSTGITYLIPVHVDVAD